MHDISQAPVPRGITHALRAPLAAIAAALEVAQLPGLDETDRMQALEVAKRQTHRMADLLALLDAFIGLGSEDGGGKEMRIDLEAVCREVPIRASLVVQPAPSADRSCIVSADPLLLLPALAGLQRYAGGGRARQGLRVFRAGPMVSVSGGDIGVVSAPGGTPHSGVDVELAGRLARLSGGSLTTRTDDEGRPSFEWLIPADRQPG